MIMEAIYRGNFSPTEQINPQDPQYNQEWKLIDELTQILASRLNKADLELFNQIMDHTRCVNCIECEESFKLGFSSALQLGAEVEAHLDYLKSFE